MSAVLSPPLPQQLARLDLARLQAYRDNLDFYRGVQWSGPPRRRERRLTFNYAKAVIDKTASYVINGLEVHLLPGEASRRAEALAREAEEALREVHQANGLDQIDLDNEIDCSVLGDACYKVTWDPRQRTVRVTAPDVQGLFAWWEPDDMARIWRVALRYQLTGEELALAYPQLRPGGNGSRPLRFDSSQHTVVEVWTARQFQLWVDSALAEERPNPYGFIPFVIYPNLREPKQFWGVSDIPPIREAVQELNRAMSQLSLILELSGNPIAVLENVSEARDIAVQPGAVWELPERARAYLLDLLQGGGVGLHVDYVNLLFRVLHDLAEVPRAAFGEGRQAVSGVALEMELDPLVKKVQRKRLLRTAAIKRRTEMVLRLLEQHRRRPYSSLRAEVSWGPVLPQDRSRLAQDEARLVAAGIHSRRTAALALGTPDALGEFERWLEEQRALAAGPAPAGSDS
ncbi:MAG TPA: phage portal protein [Dehalococcoidia bacterium]|nr:phage portal protein [Dehalococcoidia bacterium]